jgi:hypothetical protein
VQVFISYGAGQQLTPDETMLHYGFVDCPGPPGAVQWPERSPQ